MTETFAHVTQLDATLSPVICLWRDWRTPLAASASYGVSAPLDDAVDDEVHRVLTGRVLLAKEPHGGAFCLGDIATSTLAPVTSSRPDDWTWITAR